MESNFKRLKLACYGGNVTMSVASNLSPILFLTFRSLYGISYSLLGLLVLINFCTQLTVDLIFSFFSHKFNISRTVKLMPAIAVVGILVYALLPLAFPQQAYLWILVGTVIISASAGLGEVLLSPVIAAIPAKDPDREMSKLHSVYAWGVVGVVIVSTVFLLAFDSKNWYWLALLLALVPLASFLLFLGAKIPHMETPKKTSGALRLLKNKGLWLSVLAIFLGGASECTMSQWASGYLEQALGIPKVWGDIFGVAMFAVMLGLGRTLYSRMGKNIEKVLFFGGAGAALCYFLAAVSPFPLLGLIACALTGFCASMLWPGMLIVATDRFPSGGVFVFALMAAGGDLGASVAPQLVGVVTDGVLGNPSFVGLAQKLSLTADQLGMKLGLLVGMLFPLCGIFVYYRIMRQGSKK